MANAIIFRGGGVGVDCDSATATTADVLSGVTFGGAAADEIQTGTMPNNGAASLTLPINGTVTIPAGYHNGSGKVTQSIATHSGGTYTPTATAQTIATTSKYLSGNIVVSGASTLKAENIIKGVNIWNIVGTLETNTTMARAQQTYNGSAFSNAMKWGMYNLYTASSSWSNGWSGRKSNGVISSGSLSVGTTQVNTRDYSSDCYAKMVTAYTVDLSLFSSIRVVGTVRAEGGCSQTFNSSRCPSASLVLRTRESTTSSAEYVGIFSNEHFTTYKYQGDDYYYGGGSASFDTTLNIASLTGKKFLEFEFDAFWAGGMTGADYSGGCTISAIYLYP